MHERSRALTTLAAATTALAVIAALYTSRPAWTSDHQDTLQLAARPGADITDMYVFPAENPKDVVFALNVHPLIPRGLATATNFDPGVMYEIKLDTVGDYREHAVLQFKAEGSGPSQRITMYGPGEPQTATTRSTFLQPLGSTTFNRATQLPGGVAFFAGPRRDPFYFDLAQFFKINPDRNYKYHLTSVPPPSAQCFLPAAQADNTLKDFNVLSLIVEMPRATLQTRANKGRINVWATASIADPTSGGSYAQVERWGRPAVKEALESFADHEKSNRREPYNDPVLEGAIYKYMTAPKPEGADRSAAIANALVRVLTPDEMQVDLSANGPATYLGVESKGKSGLPVGIVRAVPEAGLGGLKKSLRNGSREFGGRDPESPVIDLSLGAIYGSIVPKIGLAADDHRETPCLTSDNVKPSVRSLDGFPYLTSAV